MKKLPYWLQAFLFNLTLALAIVVPYMVSNGGYFTMSFDFAAQQLPFGIFINESVKSGNILWSDAIDLGSNFLESFSYYNIGSVFTWLSLLFPASLYPKLIGWMIILKLAAAGLTSSLYLKRYLKRNVSIVLCSALYTYSGFVSNTLVFFTFLDVIALFPLMLLGLELLCEDGKKGILCLGTALNALCNYVFWVAEVIFVIGYFLVKYVFCIPSGEQRNFKEIARKIGLCIFEGGAGACISAVVFFPSVMGLLGNSRASAHIQACNWLSLSTADWLTLLKTFLMPAEAMCSGHSVIYADWMSNTAYLPVVGALFAVAYLISKKDWLSCLLKLCLLFAMIPVLNSSFMMFSEGPYRRWYFMMILMMVLASGKVLEDPEAYRWKKATVIYTILLLALGIFLKYVPWNSNGDSLIFKGRDFLFAYLIAGFGIAVSIAALRFKRPRFLLLAAIPVVILTFRYDIGVYRDTIDNTGVDFQEGLLTRNENQVSHLTEIPMQLERNIGPYRYYFNEGISYTYYNMAMVNSLPSINSFTSTLNVSIGELYDSLGSPRGTMTPTGFTGTKELLGAKYILSEQDLSSSGYSLIRDYNNSAGETVHLYENPFALSIAFTYDTYMRKSDFETLDPEVRAIAMLTSLVVKDEEEEQVQGILTRNSDLDSDNYDLERLYTETKKHQEELCTDYSYEKNVYRMKIDCEEEKYVFFSIPYTRYWKAEVNGAETELLNCNGLMAVKAKAGENVITLTYVYWPLKVGVAVSIVGIVSMGLYVWKKRRALPQQKSTFSQNN